MGKRGFTLIEILFVILVIGILVGILMPRISNVGIDAKKKAAMADLRTLKAAVESYVLSEGQFPPDTSPTVFENALTDVDSRIVDEVPEDPFNKGTDYVYDLKSTNDYYVIYSFGPDGNKGTITVGDDAITASGDGADNVWVSNCKINNHNP